MANAKKPKKPSRARRTSTASVRVFAFGIPFLSEKDRKLIHEEVFNGFLYNQELIRIERDRRDRYREIRRKLSPKLDELEAHYDELENEYLEIHSKTISRNNPETRKTLTSKADFSTSEAGQELKALRERQKLVHEQIKVEQKRVTEEVFKAADKEFAKRLKAKQLAYLAANYEPLLKNRPADMDDDAFNALFKKAKAKAGSNNKALNALRAEVLTEMTADKKWPAAWQQKAKSEQAANEAAKAARAKTTCWVGTYLKIEDAAKRSFADSVYQPKFRKFDHTGLVGIQLQKDQDPDIQGVTVARALDGTATRIRIERHPGVKVRAYERAAKRFKSGKREEPPPVACTAHIKVEGRTKDAVWIHVPFVMHRELPADGVLKWAMIKVDRIGTKPKYELQLHVESAPKPQHPQAEGTLAIRTGWQVMTDGPLKGSLKVATTWDGQKTDHLFLPVELINREEFAEHLLGVSDRLFDMTRSIVQGWIKQHSVKPLQDAFDQWLAVRSREPKNLLASLPKMRNHGTLATLTFALLDAQGLQEQATQLWARWKQERQETKPKNLTRKQWRAVPHKTLDLFGNIPESDQATKDKNLAKYPDHYGSEAFHDITAWLQAQGITDPLALLTLYLEWWRRKDQHLIDQARHIKNRVRLHRREIYRTYASKCARTYKHLIQGKFDKRDVAENPDPENDTRTPKEERANALRHFCGVSVLETAMLEAFGKSFTTTVELKDVPKHHYGCPVANQTTNRCEHCQKLYEPDANAARHLWSMGSASGPVPSQTPAAARVTKKPNDSKLSRGTPNASRYAAESETL